MQTSLYTSSEWSNTLWWPAERSMLLLYYATTLLCYYISMLQPCAVNATAHLMKTKGLNCYIRMWESVEYDLYLYLWMCWYFYQWCVMHYFGAHSNGFQRAGMWGIVALQEIRRWVALTRSRSQIHVINFTIQKPNITNVINHRATKKVWPINSRYTYKIIFCNTETKLCKCLKPQQTKEMNELYPLECVYL